MKGKQAVILFLVSFPLLLSAAESTNRLRFPLSGFSIAPLEVAPGQITCQPLTMSLPATSNFAGNVNVQIQPYSGTIDEYMTLTLKQFKDAGIKLIEQKKAGRLGVVFEYSGELQGQSLHWYARAEKAARYVYLATATAAEQDWPKQASQLKNCVDSFRCESGRAVAGPNAPSPAR